MQTFYKHEPNKFQFFVDIIDNRGNKIGFTLDDQSEYLFDEFGGYLFYHIQDGWITTVVIMIKIVIHLGGSFCHKIECNMGIMI